MAPAEAPATSLPRSDDFRQIDELFPQARGVFQQAEEIAKERKQWRNDQSRR